MNDFDFALTLGPGERAWRALFAVRSIKRDYPEASSYVLIPEEDKPHVPQEVLEEIRELAIVKNGELPMKNYPISSKIRALEIAVEQSEADHQILLDSDVALVDRPQIESNAELMAKPEDITNYYTRTASSEEWNRLSSQIGIPDPPRDTFTDVDKTPSRRYYNAGVVATSAENFPSRWLQLTRTVRDKMSRPFQADQVALAFLSTEYEFDELERKNNFPVPHFLRTSSDARIIHYHGYDSIIKIRNEQILEELDEIGLLTHYKNRRDLSVLLSSAIEILKVPKRRFEVSLMEISNSI